MNPRRRLTPEQRSAIVERWNEGWEAESLGPAFDCSPAQVRAVVNFARCIGTPIVSVRERRKLRTAGLPASDARDTGRLHRVTP